MLTPLSIIYLLLLNVLSNYGKAFRKLQQKTSHPLSATHPISFFSVEDMEHKLYLYFQDKEVIMDLQAEIKWIETALLESKDPRFVEAVKNMILSMRKVKESLSKEQLEQDELMAEAEADIKAGNIYTKEETHKIVEGWELK